MSSSTIPSNWALSFTEMLSKYLSSLFHENVTASRISNDPESQPISPATPLTLPPLIFPMELTIECEHAARVLCATFQNKGESFDTG
jgi:hypothetical protein